MFRKEIMLYFRNALINLKWQTKVYEKKIRLNKIKNNLNLRVELLSQLDKNTPTKRINRAKEKDIPRNYSLTQWSVAL